MSKFTIYLDCQGCSLDYECGCHPIEDLRVYLDRPICEYCLDEHNCVVVQSGQEPCDWKELPRITKEALLFDRTLLDDMELEALTGGLENLSEEERNDVLIELHRIQNAIPAAVANLIGAIQLAKQKML